MQPKRPTCIITLHDEETQTISHHHVAQSAITSAMAKSTSFDVPIADFGYTLDDEFARKLGATILLTLAGRYPSLQSHLAITTNASDSDKPPAT
ncbi:MULTISPECIES: hypothetical protein [Burkholderiaceae]|uniref:hypothetical protein n=1 Tax=Burkholderiaceae TaxID=119060 RepID=UPI0014209FF9|nr:MULTISPECIES: hypothetical protein [Burkholderiaceae]NIF55827.1 hypothetical protein [Burkholderia sp. Ax-1724]NIF79485.1 hypothetical protein [Paraburkholderia sp. Cy-641]